jgi:hypothetical protein
MVLGWTLYVKLKPKRHPSQTDAKDSTYIIIYQLEYCSSLAISNYKYNTIKHNKVFKQQSTTGQTNKW